MIGVSLVTGKKMGKITEKILMAVWTLTTGLPRVDPPIRSHLQEIESDIYNMLSIIEV